MTTATPVERTVEIRPQDVEHVIESARDLYGRIGLLHSVVASVQNNGLLPPRIDGVTEPEHDEIWWDNAVSLVLDELTKIHAEAWDLFEEAKSVLMTDDEIKQQIEANRRAQENGKGV